MKVVNWDKLYELSEVYGWALLIIFAIGLMVVCLRFEEKPEIDYNACCEELCPLVGANKCLLCDNDTALCEADIGFLVANMSDELCIALQDYKEVVVEKNGQTNS